jgi:hypothetical protein
MMLTDDINAMHPGAATYADIDGSIAIYRSRRRRKRASTIRRRDCRGPTTARRWSPCWIAGSTR